MSQKDVVISGIKEFEELVQKPRFRISETHYTIGVKRADYIRDEIMRVFDKEIILENQPVVFDSLSIDSILPELTFAESRNIFTYPVFSLYNRSLKEPIEITIETDDAGKVVVWCEDFGVAGIGVDKEEALKEFEELLYADYSSLKNVPVKQLSEGAVDLLRKYEHYLG